MSKLSLTSPASGYATATVETANNAAIVAAIENTISRDGTSPNQMNNNLDMNSFSVINLSPPASDNAAVRLIDLPVVSTQALPYYARSNAEIAASVTPTVSTYYYGDIRRYGATVGVNCDTKVTTAASCNSQVTFPSGAWVITATPTIPAGVNIVAQPGATFSGSGAGALGLSTAASIVSNQISDFNPPVGGELATLNIFRNPSYTGGPAGVNAGLRVQTNVGANVTNFEWAIIGIVNNANTAAGQNVGVCGQGNKLSGASPTWGGLMQAIDKGAGNPASGCVGLEVNCDADGTDNSNNRVGIDVVCHQYTTPGQVITYGVRVRTDNSAGSKIKNGFYADRVMDAGMTLALASGSTVGINISGSTLSGPAIRLAQNQYISFDASDLGRVFYDTVGLCYVASGTKFWRVDNANGVMNLSNGVAMGTADALVTQLALSGSTVHFSHRAQDTLGGTTRTGAILTNNSITASTAVSNYRAFEITSPTLNSGATITNNDGFYCNDMTAGGTRNAATNFNVTAGSGKWNLFAQGTALNHMKGALLLNQTSDNAVDILQATGSILATTNIKANAIMTSALTVAVPAAGSTACGILVSSTANLGYYFGSGAPTFSAAQGSVYSSTTGGVGARLYVNTNGSTTWAAAASP